LKIIKASGKHESVKFDKITARIRKQTYDLNKTYVDVHQISQEVISQMSDLMTSRQLDELICQVCASKTQMHGDYSFLASRIEITSLYKTTKAKFSEAMAELALVDSIRKDFNELVQANADFLDDLIVKDADFTYDYFAIKTLQKSYLLKDNNTSIKERPQHMLLRTAVEIHRDNLEKVSELYSHLSAKKAIFGSPNLFNSGTSFPQLSSCVLIQNAGDSREGLLKTFERVAHHSAEGAGIGLNLDNIRSNQALIKGTKGKTSGIMPTLKVLDALASQFNQNGRRNGSFGCYMSVFNANVEVFINAKLPTGDEKLRARDLFYALTIPDNFMRAVQADDYYYLMCYDKTQDLLDLYGDAFDKRYQEYIDAGNYTKKLKARDLWSKILTAQSETGQPSIIYKDNINHKNNQANQGTVKQSNLCIEVVEVTDENTIAQCNLGSIVLPSFVKKGKFDHKELHKVAVTMTHSLDRVIDVTRYSTELGKDNNNKSRPIGLGVSGLAGVFTALMLPYDSPEARKLNIEIFETIQFASLTESCRLAKEFGPYEYYEGSPASKGILQVDMWDNAKFSGRWDWDGLRANIAKYGLRNSMLTALMPTASTANICGVPESFEPVYNFIMQRKVLSGEFTIINQDLVNALINEGLWDKGGTMKERVIKAQGSIQGIMDIPEYIRDVFKTTWETKVSKYLEMCAERGPFIDQSQSMNIHMEDPSYDLLTKSHFKAWSLGLKTGIYYLRTRAVSKAFRIAAPMGPDHPQAEIYNESKHGTKFRAHKDETNMDAQPWRVGIEYTAAPTPTTKTYTEEEALACSLDNPEDCEACGA
jgi:ribonucleoside-diphosphate reductase alpha chain